MDANNIFAQNFAAAAQMALLRGNSEPTTNSAFTAMLQNPPPTDFFAAMRMASLQQQFQQALFQQQQLQQQQNYLLKLQSARAEISSPIVSQSISSPLSTPVSMTSSPFSILSPVSPVISTASTASSLPTSISNATSMSPQSLPLSVVLQRLQGLQNSVFTSSPTSLPILNTPIQTPVAKVESPPFLIQGVVKQEESDLKPATTNAAGVPTPEWTPSPHHNDLSRPSPAASTSTQKSQEDEENDEDAYIDVEEDTEDVNKDTSKKKRKAHVEFYRKLKSLRTREKQLQCSKCDSTVENNDHAVVEHINTHIGSLCYRCKTCGWETSQKTHIYTHIKDEHPNKPPKHFDDRRDMEKLSNLISDCFPRHGSKTKIGYTQFLDKLVKSLKERAIDKVKCKLCEKTLPSDKQTINKHIHSHPAFRCKVCKFTSETLEQQTEHCLLLHQVTEPKATVDYNLCSAADVLVRSFQKCFADYVE